jgi:hypothetical protein
MLRRLAVFWIIFLLSPLLILYFTNLFPAALWIWTWAPLWGWFIYSKQGGLERGLIFLIGSVLIATIGKSIVSGAENSDVVEMVYQLILMIGGSVGGNFISHYLILDKK